MAPEQIAARVAGVKKYWARMTPEEREARKARQSENAKRYWATLDPRKKKEQRKKMRAGVLMAYSTNPGYREAVRAAAVKQHAEGRANPGEMTDERRRKISEAQKGKPRYYLTRDDYSAMGKLAHERHKDDPDYMWQFLNPETRERALRLAAEEAKTNPRRGKFKTNCHASDWSLIDPNGVPHRFRNLAHFIREHQDLFAIDDVRVPRGKPEIKTKAYGGLSQLRVTNTNPAASWKGWTWDKRRLNAIARSNEIATLNKE